MAAEIITSLVLLCSALTLPAVAQLPFGDCNLTDATTSNNYNLSMNPKTYKINSNYTVTLSGSISTTKVLFQVFTSPNGTDQGAWEDGTASCNGIFFQINDNQNSLVKKWTSPNNSTITNVTIRAYVRNDTSTVVVSFILPADDSSTTATAVSNPTTATVTANSATNTTAVTKDTNATTVTMSKTTNSTPALQSSSIIFGVIQIVVLAVFCHLTS